MDTQHSETATAATLRGEHEQARNGGQPAGSPQTVTPASPPRTEEPHWRGDIEVELRAAAWAVRRSAWSTLLLRLMLSFVCGAVLLVLIYQTFFASDMAFFHLFESAGSEKFDEQLLATSLGVLALLLLSVFCISALLIVQSRGSREFESGLEQLSRLRREASVGVPRSRALSYIFEETLQNAKRSFTLQLWFGRTVFITGLVFLAAFVLQGIIDGINWATVTFAGGSFLSFLAAAILKPQEEVGLHLANVTQLQTIITTYNRRVSALEENIYKIMEGSSQDPRGVSKYVSQSVDQLGKISDDAVLAIQKYVESQHGSADRPPSNTAR